MAVSKLMSGFECEFVEKPPEVIQTECPICLLILREPYQVICCGKSFCCSCIGRVKASNNPCPHCNEPNFNDYPNKGLQQPLYQLKVQCFHQKEGCKWTGELGTLDNHLNLNYQPDNKLKGCVFVMVKCSHCSESHQRQHINHHERNTCKKRPSTCKYCKKYKSTFEDVTTNHWLVCGYYLVECSNKCGAVFQRQNAENHVTKDCPLTVIQCDFHYAGCEVKLPRKDMGEHLRVKSITHMSMMAASHQQEIASYKQQLSKYKQLQDQDRQRVSQLARKNQQLEKQQLLLEKENEDLKQRVTKLKREQEIACALNKALHPELEPLPIDFTMDNFEEHKKNNKEWISPPFYTHHKGYKLCLSCDASGYKVENYVSVFVHMMQGEFDDDLEYPLEGTVTIQLLNDSKCYTTTIQLTDDDDFYLKVTETDRREGGNGERCFVCHEDCYKWYINNDSLHFRIVDFQREESEFIELPSSD